MSAENSRHQVRIAAKGMPGRAKQARLAPVGDHRGGTTTRNDTPLNSALARGSAGKIVRTATQLVLSFGYEKTGVADIAKALKMSPANVYRFFRSKDDLRRAVFNRILDANFLMALRMSKLPLDPSSRISGYLKKQWLMMADIRSNHRTIYDFIIVRLDLDNDLVERHITRIGDVLAGVIAEGIDRGEFPNQDPRRTSAVFINATAALWHPKLLSSSPGSCSYPDDLVQFALSALISTELSVFTG